MSLRHSLMTLSAAALMSMSAGAGAHAIPATGCPGTNLLDGLKTANAPALERILKTAEGTKNGKAVLWKIESEEEPDHPPSFLFGTLPLTDARLKKLAPAVEEALDHTNRIATAVENLTSDRILEALGVMQRKSMATGPGARLAKVLAKGEADRAAVIMAHTELPKEWQPQVKPWVVMLFTGVSDCEQKRLKEGKLTMDGEMEQQAENRGVGSFGLEAAEVRFASLAAIPDEEQLSLLKAKLAGQDQIDDQNEALIQLYLGQNIGALWPAEVEFAVANGADRKALETYRQKVYEDSNLRMRDRSLMHLAMGGVFMAVGAEHLPGDKGMIELLRDAGYKVTAVQGP